MKLRPIDRVELFSDAVFALCYTLLNMSIENRLHPAVTEPTIVIGAPIKRIPEEYASMNIGDTRNIPPVENAKDRLYRIENMVKAYRELSTRQFAHLLEEMMHINGYQAQMTEAPHVDEGEQSHKIVRRQTTIGRGITHVDINNFYDGTNTPAFTWKNNEILREPFLHDSHSILTEEGILYVADPVTQSIPRIQRHVSPFRTFPVPPDISRDLVAQEEHTVLERLGKPKTESLGPEELHGQAKHLVDLYKTSDRNEAGLL